MARKGLEWAPHEIAYKIGLDISPVQKLTVTKAPGAKIIPILPGEASPGDQITFDASQSTGIDGNSSFEWIVTGNSALINKTEKKFIYTVQPNDEKLTVQLKVSNGTCPDLSKDFVIHINRNIDLIKESVCSDKTKVNLKSKFPEGAVLVDGAEIMSEEFIVKPVSLNLAATKPFTVTYKINGTLAMAEITVVVANADFTMQLVNIPVGTGSNTRVGLVLKPNNSSTTKEWTIKQGRAVSDITDGVPIDITALHFTLSREIEITHIATSTESGITCPNTKTFTLNKEIVDHMRNNNNQPIDNHFVLR